MGKLGIGMMVGIGAFVMLIIVVVLVIGVNNRCVAFEAGIKAQYDQDKNNYDNYFKKIAEASQVPSLYRDDMKKVYDGVMAGRYGPNGSKAMMQWIQEHNPNFDSSLYTRLQQMIEAGRNSFEAEQKALIDKKRAYETYTGSFPASMIAGIFGFPKIDLAKYGIVTSEETEKAFEEKKSQPLKLRPEEEKK